MFAIAGKSIASSPDSYPKAVAATLPASVDHLCFPSAEPARAPADSPRFFAVQKPRAIPKPIL